MNPTELRMMWMSQYNPERMSLDDTTALFHPSAVGLSIVDDMTSQSTVDINPMMSLVGGDFNGHAAAAAAAVAASSAAAAAALGVQPSTLLAANANDIYGFAQIGNLHQQLLQQSAANVFQNFTAPLDNNGSGTACTNPNMSNANGNVSDNTTAALNISGDSNSGIPTHFLTTSNVNLQQQQLDQQQQHLYDQMDEDMYEDGASDITPKQEIINIDDFVIMTDSNSYDGSEMLNNSKTSAIDIAQTRELDDTDLLVPMNEEHKLLSEAAAAVVTNRNLLLSGTVDTGGDGTARSSASSSPATPAGVSGHSNSGGGGGGNGSVRSQRKTRKIEPVNRPGLVLKTPIAYKGNIDPAVIPIQKDGMAVCERCGAIGVKHTFYTKSRRFCSMSCARGELYSLVVNNKITNNQVQHTRQLQQQQRKQQHMDNVDGDEHQQQTPEEIQLALRVAQIKNSNYRFRITDQSKITQINGIGEPINNNNNGNDGITKMDDSNGDGIDNVTNNINVNNEIKQLQQNVMTLNNHYQAPKALRMFHDVMPQEALPQIPKLERLPTPCPQMEKIISIRRRLYDPTHSYDWTPRLGRDDFYAAPVTCFPHAPGYEVWDNLGLNMKVEVENTDCDQLEVIQPGQTPHSFWVATILNIHGYKALMRYEGFDDDAYDFWVNLCNAEVHSVGWCATRGKPLIPPRTIENKYKDWKDFLVSRLSGARTLPSSFYNKINDSMQSRFRLGLNLECVDKDRISQVRLATVTKIVGKRLFLRYFDSDDGFWCHEDSPIIHPVGWATTVGHNLAAPQDYLERMLAGREAMIEVHEDDATIELFKMNFTFEEYYVDGKSNSFIEGMKLEAVDPLNLSSICAATVMAVLKFGYMMIRIDSYQPDATGADWFCYHEKSPNIFPVGFCSFNNIALTPPNGYDSQTFSWEKYLINTNSIPAGEHLFHREVPNHGFEVGMSLECADLMDPRLVCVATVGRVVGRLLKVHFDGWTEEYDQWLDCESPDIYPVGWCVLVNHKLEGPPTPIPTTSKPTAKTKPKKTRKKKGGNTTPNANVGGTYKTNGANAVTATTTAAGKTRTIALKTNPHLPKLSIKLELKPEHQNPAFYEDNSINIPEDDEAANVPEYDDSSNSLQSSSQSSSAVANASLSSATVTAAHQFIDTSSSSLSTIATTLLTTTNTTTSILSAPTLSSSPQSLLINPAASTNEKVRKKCKYAKIRTTTTTTTAKIKSIKQTQTPAPPITRRKANSYIANSSVSNSKYIPRLNEASDNGANQDHHHSKTAGAGTTITNELLPESWNIYDVSQFLRVNDCTALCDTFSRNKVDGKRLMQLSKDDIITLLGMKVGPALKIYDMIQQLKCKVNPSRSRLHKNHKFL